MCSHGSITFVAQSSCSLSLMAVFRRKDHILEPSCGVSSIYWDEFKAKQMFSLRLLESPHQERNKDEKMRDHFC